MIDDSELQAYVGKEFEVDFTREDLEEAFPTHSVFISNKNALALANFRPDRIRVWLNDENEVVKILTG